MGLELVYTIVGLPTVRSSDGALVVVVGKRRTLEHNSPDGTPSEQLLRWSRRFHLQKKDLRASRALSV